MQHLSPSRAALLRGPPPIGNNAHRLTTPGMGSSHEFPRTVLGTGDPVALPVDQNGADCDSDPAQAFLVGLDHDAVEQKTRSCGELTIGYLII